MEHSGERRGFDSPIEVGKTYDVKIEEVGREGDGVARIEGFVVFVPKRLSNNYPQSIEYIFSHK